MLAVAKVAATYAGTIIGAGFASGQELLQFFVIYGSTGLAGILLAGCLFIWLGCRILELGHRLQATGYHQLLYYVCGARIGLLLDIIVSVFLFCVLTVMLAGAGTVCRDNFGLPYLSGLLAMSFLTLLTALRKVEGITTANLIVTPLLAIATLATSLYSLSYHGIDTSIFNTPSPLPSANSFHWLLASLLYVSYNLVMGTTVLAPLGAHTHGRITRLLGGVIGGAVLALLAGCVTLTVMLHYPQVLEYEVPMLYITSSQHNLNHLSYIIILIAAMYTTALASLYGCATKLQSVTCLPFTVCLVIILTLSLVFSQAGFANLITVLFPIFGYATLWFTIKLIWQAFRDK
jgi:uncharacterized membrane protein YkvI